MNVRETTNLNKIAHVMTSAFCEVPIATYVSLKFAGKPIVTKTKAEIMEHYLHSVQNRIDAKDIITECNDHAAVAIWRKPNHEEEPVHYTNDPVFNRIWIDEPNAKKQEVFGNLPRYTLYLIGRDFDRDDSKGCAAFLLEDFKKRADKENVGIYLESVSLQACALYEKYGFKTYMNIHVGEGEIDERGYPDTNGKGYTCYYMIYLPQRV